MLELPAPLPCAPPALPWAPLGARPAGLVSEGEVPVRQGVLPVQDGVPQLPPAEEGGWPSAWRLPPPGPGLGAHSPAGPQPPRLGRGAEPTRGLETHAAHDSVPDVLPVGKGGSAHRRHSPRPTWVGLPSGRSCSPRDQNLSTRERRRPWGGGGGGGASVKRGAGCLAASTAPETGRGGAGMQHHADVKTACKA